MVEVKACTVEYEREPLGIGERKPRFSWKLGSERVGAFQTAYRIRVATDREALNNAVSDGTGIVWDSGQILSGISVLIAYEGREVRSNTDYYWAVQVWSNQAEEPSPWSEIGHWSTGLLETDDWVAEWVSLGTQDETEASAASADAGAPSLDGAQWICFPGRQLEEQASLDMYAGQFAYFRGTIEIPGPIRRALLTSTGDSRPLLFVNGQLAYAGYHFAYPLFMDVTEMLDEGCNVLAYCVNEAASYGVGVHYGALCTKLIIELLDGRRLELTSDSTWKVSEDKPAGWNTADFDDSDWVHADEAASFGAGAWVTNYIWPVKAYHPTKNENGYIRRTFAIDRPIKRAYVYATALGVYELYVNGAKMGDAELAPGWTDYNKRLMVQAYDVTSSMVRGNNRVGLAIGPGWYAGCVAMFGPYQYGTRPYAAAQLHIEYEDGNQTVMGTDASWEWTEGPILFSDLLMGEIHDARREIVGWTVPDSAPDAVGLWRRVGLPDTPFKGKLEPQSGPSVRALEQLEPVSMVEPKPGVFVFNIGQNLAGRARIRVKGPAGTRIRLRFAEMMNKDGTIYTESLRGARQEVVYILRGTGETETFEPRFTFHGFQYVEVTGYPGRPSLDCLTAVALLSETPQTGDLETSDPLINRLIRNIEWGQKGNFLSVPTDCPQRDERLGWTGDAQIFVRTAAGYMNVGGFFTKWMEDVADAQREDGAFTNVAPTLGWLEGGIAAWGDAGVIVPWTIYQVYGDKRILERHYSAMERFIGFMAANSKDWLRPNSGFGDWLSIGADTPKDVLATAYFAYSTGLLARIAEVLGRSEDAKKYADCFESIRRAFQQAYVNEDGTLQGDTQTVYLLALRMGLLAPESTEKAVTHLVEAIRSKGTHLSTGFVGVSYLLPMLSEHGRDDLAYELLQQEYFPSWLYSVLQGATTIWERWDGWTLEHGPQKAVMNSFNHYSLGSVGEWLYRYMIGLDLHPDCQDGGYKRFIVKPHPGGRLTFAKLAFESMYGAIKVYWEKAESGRFRLQVTVPANTSADIWVPLGGQDPKSIRVSAINGLSRMEDAGGFAVFQAVSGSYEFAIG